LGAKPPKIFKISRKFALKKQNLTIKKGTDSLGMTPRKTFISYENWPPRTNLTIKEAANSIGAKISYLLEPY
jgi:hypothetical protein